MVLGQVPGIRLLGPEVGGGKAFLEVTAAAGSLLGVQTSSDLRNWSELSQTNVPVDGKISLEIALETAKAFYRAVVFSGTGPDGFIWIEPGTFVMGSPASEAGRYADEVQHTVTLTRGFWLCDHEVTQAEYERMMGSNPSSFRGEDRPVEQVSWTEAVLYCERRTELERLSGGIMAHQAYRLPTEAEWEYAARARTLGAWYGGLDAIGWWAGNSGGQSRPVKGKQPNAWGLYDMIGNVWEWCSDWYGAYPAGSLTDPTGPSSGTLRVFRGGSWDYTLECTRAAQRFKNVPDLQYGNLGFRVVLGAIQ
jgi:formylglycine-generating enzyme required for sulfatase activity